MGLFLQFAVLAIATWNMIAAISSDSQVNISICNWDRLRANVIRDTIYLDGKSLLCKQSDGGESSCDDSKMGVVYNLSLTKPFNQTTNVYSLLKLMPKPPSDNNVTANFTGGTMFVNDNEFILYGGLQMDSSHPPTANSILVYEQDLEPQPGVITKHLPDGVTRYITDGGAVSAPSENLGFYFSGRREQNWGKIGVSAVPLANVTANTLITVNMSTMENETWSNNTLPGSIPGRINAELVWIPVSQSGVLIAIGGVLYSNAMVSVPSLTATQAAESNQTSPTFMQTVPVYDIANKQWYMQQTSGDIPPQLTLFCSVVAAAADNSSYNIYIYGGYDGIDSRNTAYDDVYVLSIPSFTWVKVYPGTSTHGRAGHKCVKVYPDQMFVLGGAHTVDANATMACLEGGIIQVFNLNTLKFQDSYSPTTWSEYNVPSLVTAQIGGNEQGGATKTAPANWTTSLATVFQSIYPGSIKTYYPYILASDTISTPASSSNSSGGIEIPTWLRAVIGVILGMAVIGIFLVVLFFCRQRSTTKPTISEADSQPVHELETNKAVELPTNYNKSSIQVALTRLHRMSDSPSLDEILVLNNASPGAGIQNNESRSSHCRGGSVSPPDIAEEQHPHCGNPDATASPDSINSTVGLPNPNVPSPRESKPGSR